MRIDNSKFEVTLGAFNLVCTMITKGEKSLMNAVDSALKCCDHVYIKYNRDAWEEVHEQIFDLSDKVSAFPMDWEKDFSKARNDCLELIRQSIGDPKSGDLPMYCLWLDSDDIIDDASAKAIRSLKLGRTKLPCDTREIIVNCASIGAESIRQMRIFQLEGARWDGKLHEQVVYDTPVITGVVEIPNITITHTGYQTQEDLKHKTERNIEILQSEEPDAKTYFELARTQMSASLPIEALESLFHAKQLGFNHPVIPFYIAECLSTAYQSETIENLLISAIDYNPDARYRLGELQAIKGNYKQAIQNLLTYLKEGEQIVDYGSMYATFKGKAIELLVQCAKNI